MIMCRYKDTSVGIRKLDFRKKRGMMAAYLTDGRELIVPIHFFPEIKALSIKQRQDYMIMDSQFFSFESIGRIFSIKDLVTSSSDAQCHLDNSCHLDIFTNV